MKKIIFLVTSAFLISGLQLNGMMRGIGQKNLKSAIRLTHAPKRFLQQELPYDEPLTWTTADKIFLATGATTLATLFAINRGYIGNESATSRKQQTKAKSQSACHNQKFGILLKYMQR